MKKKPTLKEWLEINGLTQFKFAESIGMKPQQMSRIVNQQEAVTFDTAKRVWKAAKYEPAFSSIMPRIKEIWPTIQRIRKEDL